MDLRAIPPCRFVCSACGKTSATRYGLPNTDHDPGWDASCMLHAVLCRREPKNVIWYRVEDSVEGVHYEAVERTP